MCCVSPVVVFLCFRVDLSSGSVRTFRCVSCLENMHISACAKVLLLHGLVHLLVVQELPVKSCEVHVVAITCSCDMLMTAEVSGACWSLTIGKNIITYGLGFVQCCMTLAPLGHHQSFTQAGSFVHLSFKMH